MDYNDSSVPIGKFLFIAFLIWLPIALVAFILVVCGDSSKAGQFGDFFGAFNCLLSALAVAGALYAVILQSHELKLAREDHESSRDDQAIRDQSRQRSEATQLESNRIAMETSLVQVQGSMLSQYRKLDEKLTIRKLKIQIFHEKYKNLPERIRSGANSNHVTTPDFIAEATRARDEFITLGSMNGRDKIRVSNPNEQLAFEIEEYLEVARIVMQEIEHQRVESKDKITRAELTLNRIIAEFESSIVSSASGTPDHEEDPINTERCELA